MPRLRFNQTPSLFPWMSLPSIPIFPIKMASRYARKFGRKEKSRTHRDDWKHKRFERSPVAELFCSPEHDFLNQATLCCLDHNLEWTDRTRKARESYWIRRLNTLRPYGINKGIIVPKSGMRQLMWSVSFV